MKVITKEIEVGGSKLTLEVGRFAGQADGAVITRLGDTMVLATVVMGENKPDYDFVPLSVEYIERLYAGGKIKGSRWVKREGRPSDDAILSARLIDRSVRPLFSKNFRREVQVVVTVLSADPQHDPSLLAIVATSAALAISQIPWQGPVGAVRVGSVSRDGEETLVANPTFQDLDYSDLDLVVSGTEKSIVMVEAGAQVVTEKTVIKAFEFAQGEIAKVIRAIKELQKDVGRKKKPAVKKEVAAGIQKKVAKQVGKEIAVLAKKLATKEADWSELSELKESLVDQLGEENKKEIHQAVEALISQAVREGVLEGKTRIDGRRPDEIRPISAEVGILPRTHGSAMFLRGDTQALTVTTLGSPSLEQLVETMIGEETKRYIHHYYMPPFSVGETGRMGWPSRREVGHGALAERALEPVVPSEDRFPYTIRVVSEIMSSNGSTSQASVCGSTLSLMDAGVPIKAPVAGIAMGLISDGQKKIVLSDILGIEDFNGDMDFKVAGTKKGITALQMDVKTLDLDLKTLEKALEQAREGRLYILDKMLAVLAGFRAQVSEYAPKIKRVSIPPDKIGTVIGPGGKVIRQLIEETGAAIDVDDDGTVNISALDQEAVEAAAAKIEGMTKEIEVGEEFEGEVQRIVPFGVFVQLVPGKDGLVHVSNMSSDFVKDPADVVAVGDLVKVKVIKVDEMGRVNLTMMENGRPVSSGRRDDRRSAGRPQGRSDRRDFRRDRRPKK